MYRGIDVVNIIENIKNNLDNMTKSEYAVAVYCLSNLGVFAFDTLEVAAEKAETSTASVIRFCKKMGFDGYKPFQECVRSGFRYQPSLPDKFRRNINLDITNQLMEQTVSESIAAIEKTYANIPNERVVEAVNLISKAPRVFTFGLREAFSMAHYAYTRMLSVRKDVFILDSGMNFTFESMLNLRKDDVCIFYMFHRYTKASVQILEKLTQSGIKVILISSAPFEYVKSTQALILPCFVDIGGIKNSYIAAASITDYLCNASAMTLGDSALKHMKEAEKLFGDFSVLE